MLIMRNWSTLELIDILTLKCCLKKKKTHFLEPADLPRTYRLVWIISLPMFIPDKIEYLPLAGESITWNSSTYKSGDFFKNLI